MTNVIHYGDNLDILREYVADESVDLIYLDPPFNSNATYYARHENSGKQIEAFDDTWHWNETAEHTFDAVISSGNSDAAEKAVHPHIIISDLLRPVLAERCAQGF